MKFLFDRWWGRVIIAVLIIAALISAYNWDARHHRTVVTTTTTAEDPSIQEMEIKAQEDYQTAMSDAKEVVTRLDAAIEILQVLLSKIEENITTLKEVTNDTSESTETTHDMSTY